MLMFGLSLTLNNKKLKIIFILITCSNNKFCHCSSNSCELGSCLLRQQWFKCDYRGAWVAQSVKHLTSAQVTISQSVSSSPVSGSVLTAQSLDKYEFTLPQEWEGKQIELVFEAVMTDAKVTILYSNSSLES